MDPQLAARVSAAVKAIHDPATPNSSRHAAQEALRTVEQDPALPLYALELARARNAPPEESGLVLLVRHYALGALEVTIRTNWGYGTTYSTGELAQIRAGVVELMLASAQAESEPEFLRQKLAAIVVEIALRCWYADWPELNDLLRQLHDSRHTHAQLLALTVVTRLAEAVFVYENAQAQLRKRELSMALSCVLVSRQVLQQRQELYGPSTSAEAASGGAADAQLSFEEVCLRTQGAYTDGWLHVAVSGIRDAVAGAPSVPAVLEAQLLLVQTAVTWVQALALRETQCADVLLSLLVTQTPVSAIAAQHAVEALDSLYRRNPMSLTVEEHDLRADILFKPLLGRGALLEQLALVSAEKWGHVVADRVATALEAFGTSQIAAKDATALPYGFDAFFGYFQALGGAESAVQVLKTVHVFATLLRHQSLSRFIGDGDRPRQIWTILQSAIARVYTAPEATLQRIADAETLEVDEYQAISGQLVARCLDCARALAAAAPPAALDLSIGALFDAIDAGDVVDGEVLRAHTVLFEAVVSALRRGSPQDRALLLPPQLRLAQRLLNLSRPGLALRSRRLSLLAILVEAVASDATVLMAVVRLLLDETVCDVGSEAQSPPTTGNPVRLKAFSTLATLATALPEAFVPLYADLGAFAEQMWAERRWSGVELAKMAELCATIVVHAKGAPLDERRARLEQLFMGRCVALRDLLVKAETQPEALAAVVETVATLRAAMARTLAPWRGCLAYDALSGQSAPRSDAVALWQPFVAQLADPLVRICAWNASKGAARAAEDSRVLVALVAGFPALYATNPSGLLLPNGGGVCHNVLCQPLASLHALVAGPVASIILQCPAEFRTAVLGDALGALLRGLVSRLVKEWALVQTRAAAAGDDSDGAEDETALENAIRFTTRAVADLVYAIVSPPVTVKTGANKDDQALHQQLRVGNRPDFKHAELVLFLFGSPERAAPILETWIALLRLHDAPAAQKMFLVTRQLAPHLASAPDGAYNQFLSSELVPALFTLLGDPVRADLQSEAVPTLFRLFQAAPELVRTALGGRCDPKELEQLAEDVPPAHFRRAVQPLCAPAVSKQHQRATALLQNPLEKVLYQRSSGLSAARGDPPSPTRRRNVLDLEGDGLLGDIFEA